MSEQARHDRIALNESRFREINERLTKELRELRQPPELLTLVCECALVECRVQISLTAAEYERVRADSTLFVVAPGHVVPDAEEVLEENERFAVAHKYPDVHDIVARTDPRRG